MSFQPQISLAVLPFGVPDGHRGLGDRLATLVWSRAGQLHPAVGLFSSIGAGVEAEISPGLWPKLWRPFGRVDQAPPEPDYVLTGALEPPLAGGGEWTFRMFRTSDLKVMAEERVSFSEEDAGSSFGHVLPKVLGPLGAFGPSFAELEGLSWEGLGAAALAESLLAKSNTGALLELERCVQDAPSSIYAPKRLGEVVFELSRRASATELERLGRVLRRALDMAPGRPELLLAEAALRWGAKDLRGAADSLRLVTALAPNLFAGHHFLARVLREQHEWSEAYAALLRAKDIGGPSPAIDLELAVHAAHSGDEAGVSEAYSRALRSGDARDLEVFEFLARSAEENRWPIVASVLIDHVVRGASLWPAELLLRASRLCLSFEPEGDARQVRLATIESALTQVLQRKEAPPPISVAPEAHSGPTPSWYGRFVQRLFGGKEP